VSDVGVVNLNNLQDNLLIVAIALRPVDMEATVFAMEVYAALHNGFKTIPNPSNNDIDKLYFFIFFLTISKYSNFQTLVIHLNPYLLQKILDTCKNMMIERLKNIMPSM
jgi:hypothetical protein